MHRLNKGNSTEEFELMIICVEESFSKAQVDGNIQLLFPEV